MVVVMKERATEAQVEAAKRIADIAPGALKRTSPTPALRSRSHRSAGRSQCHRTA